VSDFPPQPARRSRVLVADDTESIRTLFRRLLIADGHDVISAGDGAAALDAVRRHQPDVILLDVGMPAMDGLEVCRRLKSDPATRLTPIVLVTGQTDLSDRIRGIEAGADEFLSKPVHPHELRARVRSLSRVKHLIDDLDSAEAAFMTLALTIEARDPLTKGHCERLASHAVRLGQAIGLGDDDLEALTAEEFELMKRHPEIGDSLCAPLQSLRRVRPIILSHHERLDGSGYPNALRGDEVPLLAQVVGVVDVFDALTSKRPYRAALAPEEAARHLLADAERGRFARCYVEAFLDTLSLPLASTVH
jgi:putative two-component system response regulator